MTLMNSRKHRFEPLPGIWRFHAIYLFVSASLGWSFFPYSVYASFLMISLVSAIGLILAFTEKQLVAHMLALAIGLITPAVALIRLVPLHTLIIFALLIFGIFRYRKVLF